MTALQHLRKLLEFLESRGWQQRRQASRFLVYSPERDSTNVLPDYELLVPRDPAGPDFSRALDNAIEAVAQFYDAPFTSIEALLMPSSEVLSVRLEGDEFQGGAAPFPQFERMLEHLKRTITRTAAFVLTDDPIAQNTPKAARSFLDDCWFMQTARGSFVTRVALPVEGTFSGTLSLFTKPIEKDTVVSTLRDTGRLVGERVMENDPTLRTDDGFKGVQEVLSVGVLEEFAKLLRGSGAKLFSLAFNRRGDETLIRLPTLTDDRLHLLDSFIVYARERLRASFQLSTEGTVFEVRRSRRGSRSSFVGIMAPVEGRTQYVTFKVEPSSLSVFLEHFRSGKRIHVEGRARRLRTQIRIEAGFQFEEL